MSIERHTGRDRPDLQLLLAAAASDLTLTLSGRQSEQLVDYVGLLHHWNATYNLTAIREPADMLTHHVVDCLAAVPALRREIAAVGRSRILDVGSGGGLPGVVFAVMEPMADVTCVDSVGKKAAFLRQAGASLALDNLHVEHARVETLASGPSYDVVVSRAFASLERFTDLTANLLSSTGIWMAMKGKRPDEEIKSLPAEVEVFHVERLAVPELGGSRSIVWMRKMDSGHKLPHTRISR